MSSKARRAIVRIGGLEVEGYQLPDGSYRFSQTEAAQVVGNPEIGSRRFLTSKAIKALLGKTYRPDTFTVERGSRGGNPQINGLPLEVVSAYWFTQAQQGNKQAIALTWALLTESLERRFDNAFGVERSESERNQRLTEYLIQLEGRFDFLADAFAAEDLKDTHIAELEAQIRRLGEEPYQLPEEGDRDD